MQKKKHSDHDAIVEQLASDYMSLREISNTDRIMSDDYDPKASLKIGKRLNKNLKTLLQCESGIDKMLALLDHACPHIRFWAARHLYPLYPERCRQIMLAYYRHLTNERERMEVKKIVDGLQQGSCVFIQPFKTLYGCENITLLNRE